MNISAVERETGLSKDVLRVWERRYGFPRPARDENAERQYPADQIAKLRAIKRLMDTGMRPGKLIEQSLDELNELAETRVSRRRESPSPTAERDVFALLRGHNATGLQQALANLLMRQGLQHFVLETVAAAQSHGRRSVDARRVAGLRGASLHRAAAGRAAHRDQRVSAPGRHAARPADDVSGRAAWARPADGRGAARRPKARSAFRSACRRRSTTSGTRRLRTRCRLSRCRSRRRFRRARPAKD